MLHLLFNTPCWAEVNDLDCEGVVHLAAQGAPIFDVRREDECVESGVIPGSRLLTFFDEQTRYDLDGWIAAFDALAARDRPFVLVCRNGIRTKRLGRYLDGTGEWPRVYHLSGGIRRWLAAERAVEAYEPVCGPDDDPDMFRM